MRKFFLNLALLLSALIAGSNVVWADVIESNFTDKDCAVGTGELQWTGTNTNKFETSGSARGVQSNKNTTAMVFTSNTAQTSALGTITKVVVKASANGARSISVTVGGNAFGSTQSVASGTANSDFTFSGSASGVIVVSFNGGSSSSTCWIKKIVVTYNASSDPSINAEDVELEGSDTEGEISYTIANAVDGASVVPTCSDDWISNLSVNEGTKKVLFDVTENNGAPREGTITLTYKKDETTYDNINVKVMQGGVINYTLATQVVPGRHYIITNGKNGSIKAMGEQSSNNRAAVDITASSGIAYVSTSAGVYEFVIAGDISTGYYTIYDVENSKYLYAASSSSNHLKIESEVTVNSRWTIDIDNETGVATIKAKDSSNRNWMRNNSTLFSCYSSGQSDIYLFERDDDESTQEVNVTIAKACTDGSKYYGTYSCPFAFKAPAGVTVSEISVVDGELLVEDYAANAVVPANTGVMLSSNSEGTKTLTLSVGGTSVLNTGNMLKPSSEAMTGDNLFYRLTMHNGETIGFYWGAENGAAFDLAANKAYLAVPNGTSAPMRFWFTDEENNSTNIENIESGEETVKFIENGQMLIKKNGAVYDVMGRVVR